MSNSAKITRFDALSNLALSQGGLYSPSALQGWLTGYVATGARLSKEQWLNESAEYLGLPEPWSKESMLPLLGFYQDELKLIQNEDMTYALLLPDEETDLATRLQSFSEWAKGFLDGFAAAGRITEDDLNEEIMEVLKHYDAFSYGIDEDDLDDDAEHLFTDLVEHARVTALFMFYHFNQKQDPALH